MILHGANPDTKKTACGKPVARRWWVNAKPYWSHHPGWGEVVWPPGWIDQRSEITCKDCVKKMKRTQFEVEVLTDEGWKPVNTPERAMTKAKATTLVEWFTAILKGADRREYRVVPSFKREEP